LTGNSLHSADKDQQESRSVARKPHDAVVKFGHVYRNLQQHRAVFPVIARLCCYSENKFLCQISSRSHLKWRRLKLFFENYRPKKNNKKMGSDTGSLFLIQLLANEQKTPYAWLPYTHNLPCKRTCNNTNAR